MKTIEEKSEEYGRENTSHLGRLEGIDSMLENAFIAGAKASQEWISVEDELPPVSDNDILIKGIDDRGVSGIADIGYMHSPGTSAEHIISLAGVLITVTHWRLIEYK